MKALHDPHDSGIVGVALRDEAEIPGHAQHATVICKYIPPNLLDPASLCIVENAGHQEITQTAALEVGADGHGIFCSMVFRVSGDRDPAPDLLRVLGIETHQSHLAIVVDLS